MGDSRLFLYGALAIMVFLVWQTWELDQERLRTPEPTEKTQPVPSEGALDVPTSQRHDMPEARSAESVADVPDSATLARSAQVQVRTDVLDLRIDTVGGNVVQADLLLYPISLDTPDESVRLLYSTNEQYVAQSGLTHDTTGGADLAHRAPSHHARYQADRSRYDFSESGEVETVTLRWDAPDGVQVIKRFRFTPGRYLVEVEHEVRNRSSEEWVGRQYRQLRRSATRMPNRTSLLLGNTEAISFVGAAYYDSDAYHKLSFEDMDEQPLKASLANGWAAMLQHYFVTAWVPPREDVERYYTRVVRGARYPEYIIGMHSPALRVSPGSEAQFVSQLYVGPKSQNALAALAEGLELTVDYGIFTILSKPLFWVLDHIYGLFGNWGLAIVLLTVLIKLLFYKLSETSYRSMARMRKFAPRIQQLRERYGSDRAKMNEAMMKMYREEKVNPLGGCWPILVQVPVFIALYWVLLESVELRQAPFVAWIHDLSVRDPFYVLPVLMGASMLVQTKLNPSPPDPFQAKLMMALPVVFTVFFLFFPAGLVLYWLVNNVLSIAQQWFIIRRMGA